jgi:hypothetical protein
MKPGSLLWSRRLSGDFVREKFSIIDMCIIFIEDTTDVNGLRTALWDGIKGEANAL